MTTTGMLPVASMIGDAVVRVPTTMTLFEAAKTMYEQEIGFVVVGDGDSPVGVLSERDIVRWVGTGADLAQTPVTDNLTSRLVWCDASAPVRDVAREMMDNYVRHVLVEEDGALVGVVSARDLLFAYTSEDIEPEE